VLPPVVERFVREGALAFGCDAAHLALPALAAVASALGNTRVLRLKRGWDEPAILWTAVVRDGPLLRSPARSKVLIPLLELQLDLFEEYRQRRSRERCAITSFDDDRWQDDGYGGAPPSRRAVLRRLVSFLTGVDALARFLEDNPRGLLAARDDLDGWLASFASPGAKLVGRDAAAWREMHLAGTLFFDRKSGGQCFLPRAAASLTGSVPPGALGRALAPESPAADLATRLLLAMPPDEVQPWSEAVIDPEAERDFHDLLAGLLALDFADRRELLPHVLTLSPVAKAPWVAFYDAVGRGEAAADGPLAAALSARVADAARLALVHHVASCVVRKESDLVPVGPESVAAGVALYRWCEAETRRIYATLWESAEQREARHLADVIRGRGGRMSVRGLILMNSRRYRDATMAEAALGKLVEFGFARWIESDHGVNVPDKTDKTACAQRTTIPTIRSGGGTR
jgi:hypothetical protein